MKKLFILACGILFSAAAFSQKYAFIDTRYIYEKMPEYKVVQKNIDATAAGWQKEIDLKQATLDKLYEDYDAQTSMMSEDMKRKKEDELYKKEKELRDLHQKRFGFEGELFKKRVELMQPLQTKVNNAVKKLVSYYGYDLILDKSEGKTIIFADPKLDKSDEILKEMGVK